jgi:hypothetical protein
VIPVWVAASSLLGLSLINIAVAAPLLPSSASCASLPRLADANAISAKEKNPDNKIKNPSIHNAVIVFSTFLVVKPDK